MEQQKIKLVTANVATQPAAATAKTTQTNTTGAKTMFNWLLHILYRPIQCEYYKVCSIRNESPLSNCQADGAWIEKPFCGRHKQFLAGS
jgi:hypothetical protein